MYKIVIAILLIFTGCSRNNSLVIVDSPNCKLYIEDNSESSFVREGYCYNNFRSSDLKRLYKLPPLKNSKELNEKTRYKQPLLMKGYGDNLVAYKIYRDEIDFKSIIIPIGSRTIIGNRIVYFVKSIAQADLESVGAKGDFSLVVFTRDKSIYKKYASRIKQIEKINLRTRLTPAALGYDFLNQLDETSNWKNTHDEKEYLRSIHDYASAIAPFYEKESLLIKKVLLSFELEKDHSMANKLVVLKAAHPYVREEYQADVYSLYNLIRTTYTVYEVDKQIEQEIRNINYLIEHFDDYKEMLILTTNKSYVDQLNVAAFRHYDWYKQFINSDTLKKEYQKALYKLSKKVTPEIKSHSFYSLLGALSKKDIPLFLKENLEPFMQEYINQNDTQLINISFSGAKYNFVDLNLYIKPKNGEKFKDFLANDLSKVTGSFMKKIPKGTKKKEFLEALYKFIGIDETVIEKVVFIEYHIK